MAKKNEGGKISGLNRFLYRGYEVYDSEGNKAESSKSSEHNVTLTVNKDRDSTQTGLTEISSNLATGDMEEAEKPAQKKEQPYCNRPIRDARVWENLNKLSDPITVAGLSGGIFNGFAEQKLEYIKLSETKKSITPRKIISEVIDMQQHITLKDGPSYFYFESDDKRVIVPKRLIIFVKAAIAAQYNACVEYSSIIASFIWELVASIRIEDYYLPISVAAESKLQEIILRELNEYLREIFDECHIKYSEVMPVCEKKRRSKAQDLYEEIMSAADAAKGD